MGEAMARNLLKSGKFNRVVVYNRTAGKCIPLVAEGAVAAESPADAIQQCDVVFGMLADPEAAVKVVFQKDGVLEAITAGKAYVDMSTVDPATCQRIAEAVTSKGGRFLEAPVGGSKQPAIDGQLLILAAGDESLFQECKTAFDIMGKRSFYLGQVGAGARMKLIINMIMGSMMGAFSEGMALADKAGLKQEELLEVLSLGVTGNGLISIKGPSILKHSYPPAFPLKHQQKDMRLALALGDEVSQPLPVAAAANEAYKAAKAMGHADDDMAAIYEAIKK
ncbi:hypothetical protein WJX72_012076 [[Myrmecia] bisecta]|uniref:Uncharacterized protein n=1 Tax=[Myrmecia] bisecta TaxID=41462 RepID=A0AAW1Q5B1_9CHLO